MSISQEETGSLVHVICNSTENSFFLFFLSLTMNESKAKKRHKKKLGDIPSQFQFC